ncbi:MAG: DUF4294 domain-containing protein [Flavobacteriales bacterium]
MTRILSLLCLFILGSQSFCSAQSEEEGVMVTYYLDKGDTLLYRVTQDVKIIAYRDEAYRTSRKYLRTIKRVKKMLPYSIHASNMYENYLDKVDEFETKKERRKYLKAEEKALKKEFEGKVRDITVTEGIILIKLIDRNTGHTGYEVLQELKGNGSAFLWQGVSRLFDSSLKYQYDPHGEDWMIEEIIQRIKIGEIPLNDVSMN